LLDDNIGLDAQLLDRPARRRIVTRRRQAHRARAGDGDNRLDGAFAEALGADHDAAAVILQGARHDFRCRGRAAVDQDNDRLVAGFVAAPRHVALIVLGVAAARGHDFFPRVKKRTGDRDGLIQQSAGVVAQIEHITDELVADLFIGFRQSRVESRLGLLVERLDADIGYIPFGLPTHGLHPDNRALQRNVEGLAADAAAAHGQRDFCARRAAHFIDRFVESHVNDGFCVEVRNQVVWLQSGLGRRRVVDRRNDLDQIVFHRHFNAEAAEFAPRLRLHFFEAFPVEVAGMRIERIQHAVDGVLDELFVRHGIDVIGPDALQHVRKKGQLPEGVAGRRIGGSRAVRGRLRSGGRFSPGNAGKKKRDAINEGKNNQKTPERTQHEGILV